MNPLPIRAVPLFIHKPERWIPRGNFGLPAQYDSVKAQPVFNEGAYSHFNRELCQDFKSQPRWCNFFQVAGVGKKREYNLQRFRQDQARFQSEQAVFSSLGNFEAPVWQGSCRSFQVIVEIHSGFFPFYVLFRFPLNRFAETYRFIIQSVKFRAVA